MQLFRGFLSRGSAPGASHKLQPWSLPLKKAGAGVSESAWSGGGESLPPVLQRYRRPRRGAGESLRSLADNWSAAPPSERCSCALRRLSPPPALLRSQAPPPARRAPRAAPSPWKFPRRPGTASPPRASPPPPPGPLLPTPPGEEKNSLSSVNSATRRSLPRRPGLRRQTPGDWWKSRSPLPPPPAKLPPSTRSDARRSAGERAPLSRPGPPETEANNTIMIITLP